MLTTQDSRILFVYDFRINPERFESFQAWAMTKGMKYWQQQPGVIRYQTFRRPSRDEVTSTVSELTGSSKQIDVFSEVEIQDYDCLDQIIQSLEFQAMQNELLDFVEVNSLSHSILKRAYDSLAMAS